MAGRRAAMDLTRLWVAILAAYALVLQAVAPTLPAMAAVPGADVICRGGALDTSGGKAGPAHEACLVHCATTAVVAGGMAAAPALPAPRLASVPATRVATAASPIAAAARGNAQPRAPPVARA